MEKINLEKYNIELIFEEQYTDFKTFYVNNKSEIFLNTVNLFKNFKNNIDDELSILIKWNINDIYVKTIIKYNKNSIDLLNYLILPYFEDIEEYEICSEIKTLYNELCVLTITD